MSYTAGDKIYQYPAVRASWQKRDVLLFANSIGCNASELRYLYELHPKFAAFPTYPIVLTFKHDHSEVVDFNSHFNEFLVPPQIPSLPNLPALDSEKVVDGERTLDILRPLPTSSEGRTFESRSSVIGVWDKGRKGTVVRTEHLLVETGVGEERLYSRATEMAFYMGQGGWGGPNGPSSTVLKPVPDASPMATLVHTISPTAHLLYRLNGDYNPLHATESPAAVVQPTPIMHGLYTWNSVCRGILAKLCESDPTALKSFQARFASPVRPGDTLITDIWVCDKVEVSGDEREWREIRFCTSVQGGDPCLTNGSAIVRCTLKEIMPSKL